MSAEIAISLDQSCDVAILLSVRDMAVSDPDAGSGYDRDAIVASITRYYQLLSRMVAIKPKDIAYAREGGRSDDEIPISKLRRLGFNDRTIDFVRHVPFSHSSDRPVFPFTTTLNYYPNLFCYPEESYKLEDPAMTEMWPLPEGRIPNGVVPLSHAIETAGLETWWMLDTNNGKFDAQPKSVFGVVRSFLVSDSTVHRRRAYSTWLVQYMAA
jgi:hypothetical protein